MAATVLNSPRAVEMSLLIVRAFVKLRTVLTARAELAARLAELEQKLGRHDRQIGLLLDAIRRLMEPPASPARRIGFAGKDS